MLLVDKVSFFDTIALAKLTDALLLGYHARNPSAVPAAVRLPAHRDRKTLID